MHTPAHETDFTGAVERAMRIRTLYHELEQHHHGSPWTNQEDVLGLVHDVGELGRLVMATEGRWVHQGDLHQDLEAKLAECLWWILALSERLGIDLNRAFSAKMAELEISLVKGRV